MKKSFIFNIYAFSFLFLLSVLSANAATIAIESNDFSPSYEHDYLASTLTGMGHSVVDVTTISEARNAGACAIIGYSGGHTISASDLQSWVNSGRGFIQIGDWDDFFSNYYEGQLPIPSAITVTITNPSHPLAQGLDSSWSGRGYLYYGWPDGAVGYSFGSLPGETEIGTLQYTVLRNYGISAYDSGNGRAVYLGLNVFGPAAGPNELTLLQNSIYWVCQSRDIPTINEWGMIIFVMLAGIGAVYYLRRQRRTER
jgi:hypothetical protein